MDKLRLLQMLEEQDSNDLLSNIDDAIMTFSSMMIVVIVGCLTFTITEEMRSYLKVIAGIFAVPLVIELTLRLWACGAIETYCGAQGKLKYLLRRDVFLDSIAVVHAVILAIGLIASPLSAINLLFIFHFVKVGRYIRTLREGFAAIGSAIRIMMPLFVILVPLLLFDAYLLYIFESEAQPEKFADIGNAFWFAVVTATTVGYGDVTPVTFMGKVAAALHMIMTIGLFGALGAQIAIQVDGRLNKKK